MTKISLLLEGERIVWTGGAHWRGFTPRGKSLAASLDVLVPVGSKPAAEPSLATWLARGIDELPAMGLRVDELEVDLDPDDGTVPDGAIA